MKRFFLIISTIVVLSITSCALVDTDNKWYEEGAGIVFAEDETDIPEAPWHERVLDPMFRPVGTLFCKIYVKDLNGNNLLVPDAPPGVVLTRIEEGGERSDIDYSGLIHLRDEGVRELHLSMQTGEGAWLLEWENGWPDDRIVCRREFSKDGIRYRYYFLVNGRKQYGNDIYLVKPALSDKD
ncbi:MAG: hypothetical protein J6T07_06165 [Bacteroidales bacterium]|nr:hypothetical protein [Bacteroidales bacterium]